MGLLLNWLSEGTDNGVEDGILEELEMHNYTEEDNYISESSSNIFMEDKYFMGKYTYFIGKDKYFIEKDNISNTKKSQYPQRAKLQNIMIQKEAKLV